jgi:hypothetical protein
MKQLKGNKTFRAMRSRLIPTKDKVVINDLIEVPCRLDSGADCNVMLSWAIEELESCGVEIGCKELEPPMRVEVVGGRILSCNRQVEIDISIETAAGSVDLNAVQCFVLHENEGEFIIGNPLLRS